MRLIYPVIITPSEQPDIRPIAPGRYILNGDFVVVFWHAAEVCILRIPSGFESDGASIQRWLWGAFWLKPDGLHRAAALAHDYLCEYGGVFVNEAFCGAVRTQVPSQVAHDLFGEIMKVSGVPRFRAKMMTAAVRLFGPRWRC